MSQNAQVLKHLQNHGRITPLEALHHYGVMRLAARIADLKAEGHDIVTEVNRDTHAKPYATYRLVGLRPQVGGIACTPVVMARLAA